MRSHIEAGGAYRIGDSNPYTRMGKQHDPRQKLRLFQVVLTATDQYVAVESGARRSDKPEQRSVRWWQFNEFGFCHPAGVHEHELPGVCEPAP